MTRSLEETLQALPGAQGLVLGSGPEHEAKQVLAALRSPANTVRWMHFLSAGREGYEGQGWPPGVAVTFASGGVAPTVAEHAMALVLALARNLHGVLQDVMPRRAFDRALVLPRARSLEGGTLAIVGYGQIGRELAQRARAFGMRIVAVSRSAPADALVDEALPLPALHDALAQADVVVLAIALTPDTRHLLDAAAFAACKPGALFVNVGRGGLVDQPALMAALAEGRLGGAGLDVTDPEPLPADHPLWNCPNLVITPHYGGSGSRQSILRLAEGVAGNARRLRDGQPLLHVVTPG